MRKKLRFITASLLGLATCFLALRIQHGSKVKAAGNATRDNSVAVIELFTSEGCSSCPPADDLLRQVAVAAPTDGQTIVVLSEHVTYWNNLGWADPFSQQLFTERQERYVSNLRVPGAYTPQMVVNGRLEFVGSDSQRLARALLDQSKHEAFPLTIIDVQRSGSDLSLRFDTAGKPLPLGAELWVALTDDSDVSQVSRGENGGRSLRHVAVVRYLMKVNVTGAGDSRVALPASIADAPTRLHHVVVLAQRPNQGEILGAASYPF